MGPTKTSRKRKGVTPDSFKGDSVLNSEAREAREAWPALSPLAPTAHLSLVTIVPDQIITIPGFWTVKLCRAFVAFLSTLPLQVTSGRPKKGDAVRVNDRYQVDDVDFANKLWEETALRALVEGTGEDDVASQMTAKDREKLWGGHVLGLNPNIRVYRYREGQFFAPHYDSDNLIAIPTTPPTPAKTTWTLLIYLTCSQTGCAGGETVFYPEESAASSSKKNRRSTVEELPVVVKLQTGMALLHKHGSDCMLHEGREVTAGEKWVLRSDLCVTR